MVNKSRTAKLVSKNKSILKLLNQTQLQLIDKIKDKKYYSGVLKNIILEVVGADSGTSQADGEHSVREVPEERY